MFFLNLPTVPSFHHSAEVAFIQAISPPGQSLSELDKIHPVLELVFPRIHRVFPLVEKSLSDKQLEMFPDRVPVQGRNRLSEEIVHRFFHPPAFGRIALKYLFPTRTFLVHELVEIPEAAGPVDKFPQDCGLGTVADRDLQTLPENPIRAPAGQNERLKM